ncbi:TolB family protein [Embleya sp. NPDC056575]|uniref:TolB family protein n=1 Tax=unclassified Embleya TaxID=2699296 RepID=UPI003699887E
MKRALALALGLLVLVGVAVGYSTFAADRNEEATVERRPLDLTARGRLVFVDTNRAGGHRTVADTGLDTPAAARVDSGLRCERFAVGAGTGVCLQTRGGPLPGTDALIVDAGTNVKRRIELAGTPSRARVSASGNMVSWTVFVSGESYNKTGFSTWTGILDTRTDYTLINIEAIPLTVDGKPYHSPDVNYWGVTFAADDNRFYATVGTKGHTYLVEGDYANWEAHTIRDGVECPSLSPDGTRIAFKKRSGKSTWRLHVLDLATMRETPLAEHANVDDQAAWLDDNTVMYGRDRDIYAVPADGTGAPRLLVTKGASPTLLR